MREDIERLRQQFVEDLAQVVDLNSLEHLRHRFLSKKGPVQALYKQMGTLTADERPVFGQELNTLKQDLEIALNKEKILLKERALQKRLEEESLDITCPARPFNPGSIHPSMALLQKMVDVLAQMGFKVITSPNMDTDTHNFSDLNFADDHPARDMQDTFYLSSEWLLRTHTSNGQILAMKDAELPVRVCIPGRCFRNETVTARSHIMFHQLEGLYVDRDVSMADLLATLKLFFRQLFSKNLEMRIRPSFFPFVEPGVEVDLSCLICQGTGCAVCKHTGWLEVAGAGMVHPNVLRAGGIDPDRYTGFAWGMGVERLVMITQGIDDIRLFTQGRDEFLKQFCNL